MKGSRTLLGIDIGTSGLKACLFDASGTLLAGSYKPASFVSLPPGQMEQAPEQWWESLKFVVAEVESAHPAANLAGVGICGFQNTPVLLHDHGGPVRPVILFNDERLPASRAEMERAGILDRVETLTQSMVSAGHFPPIYHYLLRHDPESLVRTRWIVLAKDYLRQLLTGAIATEICDASGLNLMEPDSTTWSRELCKIMSIPPDLLPPIGRPAAVAGVVTRRASKETGLPEGLPVVYGGGDSHCALLGLGCISEGDTGLVLGTNSTLRTVFRESVSHPRRKVWTQRHVVAERFTVSASSMAGAAVLQWFGRSFGQELQASQSLEAWTESAADIPLGSGGISFLPHIFGERSPFYDPQASGAFVGLRSWHTPRHLLRSVLEGVALNIGGCFDLIEECALPRGARIDALRLGGGGSRASVWHQIISDVLNKPIQVMATSEAGTLGAALLAGLATGVYDGCAEAVRAAVRIEREVLPDSSRHEQYLELKGRLSSLRERIAHAEQRS